MPSSAKPPLNMKRTLLLLMLLLAGCQTPLPPPRPDQVPPLLAHPQFPAAKAAAPDWARAALTTINDLQLDNAQLRANAK